MAKSTLAECFALSQPKRRKKMNNKWFLRVLLGAIGLATAIIPGRAQSFETRWEVDTFAGTVPEKTGPALEAFLSSPSDLAVDAGGNVFIADSPFHWIRKVTPGGEISVFAGSGEQGFSGDGGPAEEARFFFPRSLALGSSGDIYIADLVRVRKISSLGTITTVAGNGGCGRDTPSGQAATDFALGSINCVTFDASTGTLYIARRNQVWKVEDGLIFHFVGAGEGGFSGDGGDARMAQLNRPQDMATGPDGSLYIADSQNYRIRKVDISDGTIRTVIGNGERNFNRIPDGTKATETGIGFVRGIAFDAAGRLHYSDSAGNIYRVDLGGAITRIANFRELFERDSLPRQLAFGPDGSLYVADVLRTQIRKIDSEGNVTTVAGGSNLLGDGGPAAQARLHNPSDLAFDPLGNLIIADASNGAVRAVSPDAIISRLAGNGVIFANIFLNDVVATETPIGSPSYVESDAVGNVLFNQFHLIRAITPGGQLRTVPGFDASTNRQISVGAIYPDPSGAIFFINTRNNTVMKRESNGTLVAVAGNGTRGFSGDGGPATQATLSFPRDITVDQNGNLYVADSNNARIRKIDSDGVITTIAGNGSFGVTTEPGLATLVPLVPSHITLGPDEDLYVTTTLGYVQRIFMPESAALSAEERREQGISDGAMITTVAGTGFPGFDGDGGDAKQARFNFPQGLVFGPDSRLYVADTGNHRIRVLTPSTAPLISPRRHREWRQFRRGSGRSRRHHQPLWPIAGSAQRNCDGNSVAD